MQVQLHVGSRVPRGMLCLTPCVHACTGSYAWLCICVVVQPLKCLGCNAQASILLPFNAQTCGIWHGCLLALSFSGWLDAFAGTEARRLSPSPGCTIALCCNSPSPGVATPVSLDNRKNWDSFCQNG